MDQDAVQLRVIRKTPDSPLELEFGYPKNQTNAFFTRESKVYRLFRGNKSSVNAKNSKVVIFYTARAFELLAKVKSARLENNIQRSLFYTAGYGVLVGVFEPSQEIEELLSLIDDIVDYYEIWDVTNHRIATRPPVRVLIKNINITWPVKLSDVFIGKLEDSEHIILIDIYETLSQLTSRAILIGDPFISIINSTYDLVHEILVQVLYLERKISSKDFYDSLSDPTESDVDKSIHELAAELGRVVGEDPVKAIENLQSLRDELVQIRACLKYYYRQGFTCFPPLLESDHPSGNDSLFGFNACFWGLQGLFEKIQEANESIQTFDSFLENLDNPIVQLTRPINVRSDSTVYVQWLQEVSSRSLLIHKDRGTHAPAHFQKPLSYFSSRLGFKATEISVTASSESISYCDRPAWHLATLLHEYTHLFVGPLFAELRNDKIENNVKLFKSYRNLYDPAEHQNIALTPYKLFKVVYWHTSFLLRQIDRHDYDGAANSMLADSLEDIEKSIERTAKDSEEIVVQTLEYSYFYQGNPEIYLKSIWSSWLSLPATYVRKKQYLLRSLLAISVEIKGTKNLRFEAALKILLNSIETLEKDKHVRIGAAKEIIAYLQNEQVKSTLKRYFFDLIEFADLASKFLVDPQLSSRMFREREAVPDGEVYTYDLESSEYSGEIIESPVRFLITKLRETLDCSDSDGQCLLDRGERHSLWIFHVIGATLKNQLIK